MHQFVSTLLLIIFFGLAVPSLSQPEIGIAQRIENDSLLTSAGYRYLVETISRNFSPRNVTDDQFEQKVLAFKKLKINLYACNLFIPGDLKLVGSDFDERAVLNYASIVFQRCKRANLKMIVWGSGAARRVPDGFDPATARVQFIAIARKLAMLAHQYGVVLALENLNATETNFINTFQQAYDIVKSVDEPGLRLCADLYHMAKEDEGAAILEEAGRYIVHCDIAEKENRTPPGTAGDDFRPYLRALKKVGYNGKIILECGWKDLPAQLAPARLALQLQIDEVWSE